MAFLRWNPKYCPEHCKTSAYINLVSSVLDYSSVVWDLYYSQDITKTCLFKYTENFTEKKKKKKIFR